MSQVVISKFFPDWPDYLKCPKYIYLEELNVRGLLFYKVRIRYHIADGMKLYNDEQIADALLTNPDIELLREPVDSPCYYFTFAMSKSFAEQFRILGKEISDKLKSA